MNIETIFRNMFISNLQIIAFITTGKYLSRRRADKNRYQHDRRANKDFYRHDRRANKDFYRHDRRANKNSIGTTVVRILTSLNNIGF